MHKNTLKKPNSQLHPNLLSPTRQENTILSSYAATRLLGIFLLSWLALNLKPNIYIYIYICQSQLGLVAIQATRAHFNKSPPWLELIKLHEQTPPLPPP